MWNESDSWLLHMLPPNMFKRWEHDGKFSSFAFILFFLFVCPYLLDFYPNLRSSGKEFLKHKNAMNLLDSTTVSEK